MCLWIWPMLCDPFLPVITFIQFANHEVAEKDRSFAFPRPCSFLLCERSENSHRPMNVKWISQPVVICALQNRHEKLIVFALDQLLLESTGNSSSKVQNDQHPAFRATRTWCWRTWERMDKSYLSDWHSQTNKGWICDHKYPGITIVVFFFMVSTIFYLILPPHLLFPRNKNRSPSDSTCICSARPLMKLSPSRASSGTSWRISSLLISASSSDPQKHLAKKRPQIPYCVYLYVCTYIYCILHYITLHYLTTHYNTLQHIHIPIPIPMYIYICVCVCMHACMHACMYVCMYVHIRIYTWW